MSQASSLGWPQGTVGELDHRQLKAPSVKLRSVVNTQLQPIYSVDFRLRRPNTDEFLASDSLHSLEHFLLEGLQRLLPENFISVGVMGCQTGFYIILVGEGRAAVICDVLAQILQGIQQASAVPYANIEQCGHYKNHNLAAAQHIASQVLAHRLHWLEAV